MQRHLRATTAAADAVSVRTCMLLRHQRSSGSRDATLARIIFRKQNTTDKSFIKIGTTAVFLSVLFADFP
jgi:hypothetical protein